MSLDTIQHEDASPMRRTFAGSREFGSLVTTDIDGASPRLKGYRYINKPTFANTVTDLPQAQPRPRAEPLNRPEYNLATSDIPGTQPNIVEFKTTRVGHNPLNPVYKLPRVETKPWTPPRFLRDSMPNDDIEGSKPAQRIRAVERDLHNVHDIDGARPRPHHELAKPDFMSPTDINRDYLFASTRTTNPLSPEYIVRDADGNPVTIGEVQGSKPRQFVCPDKATHNRNLIVSDIDGATSTKFGVGNLQRERANPRNPNAIDDIQGSQADTRKKKFNTMRATNPLDPEYQLPGHSEQPPEHERATKGRASVPLSRRSTDSLNRDAARFYGLNPPSTQASMSTTRSVEVIGGPRDSSYSLQRNARRFFEGPARSDPPTPGSEQRRLDAAAQVFYAGAGTRVGQTVPIPNPASIHRAPKAAPLVSTDSPAFQADAQKFYAVQQAAHTYAPGNGVSLPLGQRPPSSASISSSLAADAERFHGTQTALTDRKQLERNTAAFYASRQAPTPAQPIGYRFGLSRQNIFAPKQPVDQTGLSQNAAKFYGMTPPPSGTSSELNRNALKFYS